MTVPYVTKNVNYHPILFSLFKKLNKKRLFAQRPISLRQIFPKLLSIGSAIIPILPNIVEKCQDTHLQEALRSCLSATGLWASALLFYTDLSAKQLPIPCTYLLKHSSHLPATSQSTSEQSVKLSFISSCNHSRILSPYSILSYLLNYLMLDKHLNDLSVYQASMAC